MTRGHFSSRSAAAPQLLPFVKRARAPAAPAAAPAQPTPAPLQVAVLLFLQRFNVPLPLEEYAKDPKAVLTRAFAHLGVRQLREDDWEGVLRRRKVTNQQGSHYKSMRMLPTTRDLLREAYTPCNAMLGELLADARFEKWV